MPILSFKVSPSVNFSSEKACHCLTNQNRLQIHTSLICLSSLFEETYGLFIWSLKSFWDIIFALSLFAALRLLHTGIYLSSAVCMNWCICNALGATGLAICASTIYETSKAFKNDGQYLKPGKPIDKHINRMFLACRPIRCNIGGFYFIEKNAKLKGIGIMIDMAACLLLDF